MIQFILNPTKNIILLKFINKFERAKPHRTTRNIKESRNDLISSEIPCRGSSHFQIWSLKTNICYLLIPNILKTRRITLSSYSNIAFFAYSRMPIFLDVFWAILVFGCALCRNDYTGGIRMYRARTLTIGYAGVFYICNVYL